MTNVTRSDSFKYPPDVRSNAFMKLKELERRFYAGDPSAVSPRDILMMQILHEAVNERAEDNTAVLEKKKVRPDDEPYAAV